MLPPSSRWWMKLNLENFHNSPLSVPELAIARLRNKLNPNLGSTEDNRPVLSGVVRCGRCGRNDGWQQLQRDKKSHLRQQEEEIYRQGETQVTVLTCLSPYQCLYVYDIAWPGLAWPGWWRKYSLPASAKWSLLITAWHGLTMWGWLTDLSVR